MKGIPILLPIILVSVLTLGSCDNSMWYGGNKGDVDFALRLELPYPEQSPGAAGRALALQGLHIFIEIADIQDTAAYTDPNGDESTNDSLFYQIPDGDGNWESTPWGGHAVVHAQAYGTEAITVEFNNVPTDRNLLVRVIQDTSRQVIEDGMAGVSGGYNIEWYPLSQTFLSGGTGPWEDLGVPVSAGQLASGQIRIPLRPHEGNWDVQNLLSVPLVSSQKFVGFSTPYEPSPGFTIFSQISLDMTNQDTVDPGMLAGYRIVMKDGIAVPGVVKLYDKNGNGISPHFSKTSSDGNDTTITSYSIVNAPLAGGKNGSNSDFFIGATLLPGVDLDDTNYTVFSLIAQPLVNVPIEKTITYSGDFSSVDGHRIGWNIPTTDDLDLIGNTDLEYKVLYWFEATDLQLPLNIFDIEEIESFSPLTLMDWSSAEQYINDVDPWDYELTNIVPILPSAPIVSGNHYFVVVLARVPGDVPFLIGALSENYSSQMG